MITLVFKTSILYYVYRQDIEKESLLEICWLRLKERWHRKPQDYQLVITAMEGLPHATK